MTWVAAALAIGALAYLLSKDDEQPRCPYCKSFVKKYAKRCPRCSAKLGGNDMEVSSKQHIRDFVRKLSKYSAIFYVIVVISLVVFQFDIFKDSFPKEYVVDGIIVISTFAIGSIALDKILSKKVQDPKPFLYCPGSGRF